MNVTEFENDLEKKLEDLDTELFVYFNKTKLKAGILLEKYVVNFPTFTDHSIEHSLTVANIASLLVKDRLDKLNSDEIYVLLSACILHDIGMCIPQKELLKYADGEEYNKYRIMNKNATKVDFIREIHHELSYSFIKKRWKEELLIINKDYAEAIALVSKAHRKIEINNYQTRFFVRDQTDSYICLPFLSCVLRLADELDISKKRLPDLIVKFFKPEDDRGKLEWEKHFATHKVNYERDIIIIEGETESQIVYNALNEQFDKIDNVIEYCYGIIYNLSNTGNQEYIFHWRKLKRTIRPIKFQPIHIGFTIDTNNVFQYFISKNLYQDKYIALREAIQNAIDTCKYKKRLKEDYEPKIDIYYSKEEVKIKDNGYGMDTFIIKNYFGKLGKSFYREEVSNYFNNFISFFGIGVFSYFMICDFFEIKTKKEDKDPIRFRVDRNPNIKTYFYFYEDSQFENEGTEIIFKLSNETKEELTYEELIKHIEDFVKDSEFSIKVVNIENGKTVSIKQEQYNLTIEEDLQKYVKLTELEKLNDYLIISTEINSENLRGILGLPVSISVKDRTLENIKPCLKDDVTDNFIEIYNKGVFIQKIRSKNLKFLFGKLNILSGLDLNLNRTEILDINKIYSILEEFEIEIISKLFIKLGDFKSENGLINREEVSKLFFTNIFNSKSYYSDTRTASYHKIFEKLICLTTFRNDKLEVQTLEDIIAKNEVVNFIFPLPWYNIEIVDLGESGIENIIIVHNYINLLILEYLFRKKYEMVIIQSEFGPIIRIDLTKKGVNYEKILNRYKAVNFDDNSLFIMLPNAPPEIGVLFNKNHNFNKILLSNSHNIENLNKISDLMKELLNSMAVNFFTYPYKGLSKKEYKKKLTLFIENLNSISNVDYDLKLEDLPFNSLLP